MATDTMSEKEKEAVRRMVVETVSRLRKAADASSSGHICGAYARLIHLLWHPPTKTSLHKQSSSESSITRLTPPSMNGEGLHQQPTQYQYNTNTNNNSSSSSANNNNNNMAYPPQFSWLDLASAADYATSHGPNDFTPYYRNMTYMATPTHGIHMPQDGTNIQQWFDEGSTNLMF